MAIGVASVTSGVGSGAPTAAWLASWTSRKRPGWIVPESSVSWPVFAPKLPVPVALAYWIDQPARLTEVALAL